MNVESPHSAAALDRAHVWHPFTQMKEWADPCSEVLVISEGAGAVLRDERGREFIDGNSSIWTNIHGHRHPAIDAALASQLGRIAHASFLGTTNEVAPRFAAELIHAMDRPGADYRVFFSDDGSTAVEAGVKMIIQARSQRGESARTGFVSVSGAYHGDTLGAMSVGHSPFFHRPFRSWLHPVREVPSPACYRCPHNRAVPLRGVDAREGRRCEWECVGALRAALDETPETVAALVMEPIVQGAAGMTMHPEGYLTRAARLCSERGVWLMLDEVMTGFGRTGEMFAYQREGVTPDVLALGKGITGGYLPLAATVASAPIHEAFLGEYAEFKTFFHGHSYSGNPLGCAAARASLKVFADESTLVGNREKSGWLRRAAATFWEHPHVGDVRVEGMVCAIELVEDFATRRPFPASERVGARVCWAARRHGLLTRPVGDVLVLMPPYCITEQQVEHMRSALWLALCEILP